MSDQDTYLAEVDAEGVTVRLEVITRDYAVPLDTASVAIAQAVGKVAYKMMQSGHPVGWDPAPPEGGYKESDF